MKLLDYIFGSDSKLDEVASLWKSANEIDKYGISVFQRNIEIVIETNLRAVGLRLHHRIIKHDDTSYITATVPDLGLRVEVFRGHLQVKNISGNEQEFCMEVFDHTVPKDHYDAADEFFKGTIANHQGKIISSAKDIARQVVAGSIEPSEGCEAIAAINEQNCRVSTLNVFSNLAHEQTGHEQFGFDKENTAPLILDECKKLLEDIRS